MKQHGGCKPRNADHLSGDQGSDDERRRAGAAHPAILEVRLRRIGRFGSVARCQCIGQSRNGGQHGCLSKAHRE